MEKKIHKKINFLLSVPLEKSYVLCCRASKTDTYITQDSNKCIILLTNPFFSILLHVLSDSEKINFAQAEVVH